MRDKRIGQKLAAGRRPSPGLSRRRFLASSAVGAGLLITHGQARTYAANERLNLALVGVGGRGHWFVGALPDLGQNLVALCDVDESRAAEGFRQHPDVPRYHDFRRMLEEMQGDIDGVVVATPDHTHAVASAAALHAGVGVYCEKPLTHSIDEARTLATLARETGLATQMGNQGTASPAMRRAVELVRAGVIGDVEKVYAWNSGANGVRERPGDTPDIPDYVKWDLWLGPAPHRPYHPSYLRGRWHSWVDFGTGQLGNWGCHMLNLPFMALDIAALWDSQQSAIEVAAEHPGHNGECYPRWLQVTWNVPARGDLPPVQIHWTNGSGNHLEELGVRATVEEHLGRRLALGEDEDWTDWAGVLLVGSKGLIHANAHNTTFDLLPEARFDGATLPEPTIERVRGHEWEWLRALRGGPAATSNFADHGSPLTQFVHLGNLAWRVDEPIGFNANDGRVTNSPRAEEFLGRASREGWSL